MPESLDNYTDGYLEGVPRPAFPIMVNKALIEHEPELLARVKIMLASDLLMIERIVPGPAYDRIKGTTFWIELQGPTVEGGMSGRGMCYHASFDWVTGHGLLGEKTGGVELCRADDFIDWRRRQPFMTLHELAHAYHHMLGTDYTPVAKAYQHAKTEGLYDQVARNNHTRTERAYAITNSTEYFSELTEAYFGLNDFFPYSREQLKEHDPQGYAAVQAAWNLSAKDLDTIIGPKKHEVPDTMPEPESP